MHREAALYCVTYSSEKKFLDNQLTVRVTSTLCYIKSTIGAILINNK